MYADDLILLSETAEGLHNCLLKLSTYCEEWGLLVNVKKTKFMIFNNTGRLVPINLKYNNSEIENVRSYSYLGVTFSISGSFREAKHDLYKRGLKAYFKIKKNVLNITNQKLKLFYMYSTILLNQFSFAVWKCNFGYF
jgi:hypothetical protein